jgi:hypothetical protein
MNANRFHHCHHQSPSLEWIDSFSWNRFSAFDNSRLSFHMRSEERLRAEPAVTVFGEIDFIESARLIMLSSAHRRAKTGGVVVRFREPAIEPNQPLTTQAITKGPMPGKEGPNV